MSIRTISGVRFACVKNSHLFRNLLKKKIYAAQTIFKKTGLLSKYAYVKSEINGSNSTFESVIAFMRGWFWQSGSAHNENKLSPRTVPILILHTKVYLREFSNRTPAKASSNFVKLKNAFSHIYVIYYIM